MPCTLTFCYGGLIELLISDFISEITIFRYVAFFFFFTEMLTQPVPSQWEQTKASVGNEIKEEEPPEENFKEKRIGLVAEHCVKYCKETGIENPVEILRIAQKLIVTGRPLDVTDPTVCLEGETGYILINRDDVLKTALEEIQFLKEPRLTLEVGFYDESAQDFGGPRQEFFRLCLQEIKAKYFDNGLKDHLVDDYSTVGLIMALSILQNGVIPRFLKEEDLQALFSSEEPSDGCISKLRVGFEDLGLYQIGNAIPNFLHLFKPSGSYALTRRKLLTLLNQISLKLVAMHVILKMKFMSYFPNTPGWQQVDKEVQLPLDISFSLSQAVMKSPHWASV